MPRPSRWFLDYHVGVDDWVMREVSLGYTITRQAIEHAIENNMFYPELICDTSEWYGSHGQ